MKNKKILAFDIGGAKIASGLAEIKKGGYKIYDYQRTETPEGKDNVINKIIEIAINYEKDGGFEKVGMAIAGQVDYEKDVVKYAPNIPGFKNVNLKKIIKDKIGKNAEIDNDAKCFALAENKFGKGKKYSNVVYLTIGTGIGGAIEIGNKPYRGANNMAGEFGHTIISFGGKKCHCGGSGCWEQYASGMAIEKSYYELSGKIKKAKDIAFDSEKNMELDKKVIKQASLYLAAGLINIANALNPEAIIIGGSVVKSKEIFNLAVKEMKSNVLFPAKKTKIEITNLEDEAFLVGAGML